MWKCKLCCELPFLFSVGITWKYVEPNWGCLRQPIKEDVLYLDKVASCEQYLSLARVSIPMFLCNKDS